jgi:gamma-glutamylcyclotransferase (GGCT)/AIG2-like uncharacterized protein YtfP
MSKKERIFVYGTLRKGFRLHKHLTRWKAKFLGEGTIRAILYDLGDYPGAILSENSEVKGELYELQSGSKQLQKLDDLEEFDPSRPGDSLFVRMSTEVELGTRKKIRALVYCLQSKPREAAIIPGGDYTLFRRVNVN